MMEAIILSRFPNQLKGRRQPTAEKVCTKCPEKGPQPIENFYKNKTCVDGRREICIDCVNKARKEKEAERKLFDPF